MYDARLRNAHVHVHICNSDNLLFKKERGKERKEGPIQFQNNNNNYYYYEYYY